MISLLFILVRDIGVGALVGTDAGVRGAELEKLDVVGVGDVLYVAGVWKALGVGDKGEEWLSKAPIFIVKMTVDATGWGSEV